MNRCNCSILIKVISPSGSGPSTPWLPRVLEGSFSLVPGDARDLGPSAFKAGTWPVHLRQCSVTFFIRVYPVIYSICIVPSLQRALHSKSRC